MKKILILLFLVTLVACDQSNFTKDSDPLVNEALAILEAQKFDVSEAYVDGDAIIVEHDIRMNIEDILASKNLYDGKDADLKQYSTHNLVDANKVNAIKVRFDSKVSTEWRDATLAALSSWNDINNASVTMYEVASGEDIYIRMGRLSSPNAIAQAEFPTTSGDAGGTVTINTSRTATNLSASYKHFTIAHELGHCVGFRHTNWFDRNSDGNATTNDAEPDEPYGANHIAGTPTGLESNSVMNAYVAPWNGFSNGDKTAAQTLYPGSNGPIVPCDTCGGGGDTGGGGPGNGNGGGKGKNK